MHTVFLDDIFPYTGKELRSRFIRERTGGSRAISTGSRAISTIEGDAAIAWVGPCEVPTENLVDMDDREAGETIRAASMLHFIVEVFDDDLLTAVYRQRLLITIVADAIREISGEEISRRGNDLFIGTGKLSVSIAAASKVSTLIHLGINVDGTGAPVETADLSSLGIDPPLLAEKTLKRLAKEEEGIRRARAKVRPVP